MEKESYEKRARKRGLLGSVTVLKEERVKRKGDKRKVGRRGLYRKEFGVKGRETKGNG